MIFLNTTVALGGYALLLVGFSGVALIVVNPLNVIGALFYLVVGALLLVKFSTYFRKICVSVLPRDILVSLRER